MADLKLTDMDEATRRRLAQLNPGLADQLGPPPPPPAPAATPPPATTRSPATRPPSKKARPAGRRRAPQAVRAVTGAAGDFAGELTGPGPTFGQLALYAAGATAAVVIVAQLVSPGGSRAVATVTGTLAGWFRKLADPLDPLIPAA